MPRRSEASMERRRREIIENARRCFGRFGYEGATLPRLEEATGLTRGGIFHHFESKQTLFVAAVAESWERLERIWAERGFAGVVDAIEHEDLEWIAVQIEASVRARTDPDLERALAVRRQALDAHAPERLERLRPRVRDDLPIEQVAMVLSALANGLALRRATGDRMPTASVVTEIVRDGMGPRR